MCDWLSAGHSCPATISSPKPPQRDPSLHTPHPSLWQIYGRHVSTPRYHRSYGHDYAFSGVVLAALPLPAALRPLVEWANSLVQVEGPLPHDRGGGSWRGSGRGADKDQAWGVVGRQRLVGWASFTVQGWRTGLLSGSGMVRKGVGLRACTAALLAAVARRVKFTVSLVPVFLSYGVPADLGLDFLPVRMHP